MIILSILCSVFLQNDVLAGPLQPPLQQYGIPFYLREIDPSKFTQRSVLNIFWSCLATLFVCSWVAVHPNIPAPSDRIFITRLKIMGCMLIMPELVILWAGRQWYAAHQIADRHKDRGWTITHGFFVSMGGFMLYDNGVPTRTLGIEELELLESEKKIHWPSISAEDIQDKSKGDFASKGFAVLQTTWFIVQCITRGIVGLNLTELELATLAFAVLNVILYTLWWDKPLGVVRPVPVHLRHHDTSDTPLDPPPSPLFQRPSTFACFCTYVSKKFKDKGLFCLIYILFIEPSNAIALSVIDMWTCDALCDSPARFSVPTFYAPSSSKKTSAIRIGLGVGILFGGIHCIAWSFDFPSVTEQSIWRSAALVTTNIPFAFFINSLSKRKKLIIGFFPKYLYDVVDLSMLLVAAVMYYASRMALLLLSLLALRSLPPESLLDFKWSSFVPHI